MASVGLKKIKKTKKTNVRFGILLNTDNDNGMSLIMNAKLVCLRVMVWCQEQEDSSYQSSLKVLQV